MDRLPAELMSLIVKQLASDDARHYDDGENDLDRERDNKWIIRERNPELKRLRFVSPRWAYLPSLLAEVFKNVSFQVSRKHLEDLKRFVVNGEIAPCVSCVTFVQPSESWTLRHDTYQRTIEETDNYTRHYRRKLEKSEAYKEWANQYERGGPSENQVLEGYQEHQRRAEANKALLQSQELQQNWTNALRTLTKCHTVRFRGSKLDVEGAIRHSVGFDHPFPLYWGIDSSVRDLYMAAAMPVGDQVYQKALECLAKANLRIHELDVMLFMGLSRLGENIPERVQPDCTALRKLIFAPMGPHLYGSYEYMNPNVIRACVLDIFKQSHSSLEHFEFQPINGGDHRLPSWIGPEALRMERLKYFRIKDAAISARNMSKWTRQMPSLDHVQLQLTGLEEHDRLLWRQVYEAFRDHPNDLRIQLGTIFVNAHGGLIADLRKSKYEDYLNPSGYMMNVDRSLALFLAGKIQWDNALEDWHS